jgi:hypothetical protein
VNKVSLPLGLHYLRIRWELLLAEAFKAIFDRMTDHIGVNNQYMLCENLAVS